MTQTMDLNKMGLAPMDDLEMNDIEGGSWAWWPFVVSYVLIQAATNPRAHIKAFMDGFNGN